MKILKREIKLWGDYVEFNKVMFGKKLNEESFGDINYVLCILFVVLYRFFMKGFFLRSLFWYELIFVFFYLIFDLCILKGGYYL